LLYVNEDDPVMPSMMLPAKHIYNYTATIRIVVSDEVGASGFVEVPVKVSYATVVLIRFQGKLLKIIIYIG